MILRSVKFISAFQVVALASAAPSATANLRRGEGRGKPQGGDKGGGGDGNQSKTILVRIEREAALADACAGVAAAAGGEVVAVYDAVLHGCAIEMPSHRTASASMTIVNAEPSVMAVEEDQRVYASYSWGLDRVDQCDLPLAGTGAPLTKVDATGVRVYVLDTGIDANHEDFDGVIDSGSGCHANMASDGTGAFDDRNGHGTHVAGTACGVKYGVARDCDLCAVRVLGNDGSGSWAGVLGGLNHAVRDCAAAFPNVADRRCVANLSLGGGFSASLNAAAADAADSGVVMVVASGNDNGNACDYSPASEPKAITVGSTTRSDSASWFSNFGSCVDVWGPGSDIVSAAAGTVSGAATFSGTSMASPHVAGIAAGILREDAAADVDARLKAHAKLLAAQAQDGSDMLLATTVIGGCSGGPPPTPTTKKPTQKPVNEPSSDDNDYDFSNDDDTNGDDGDFPSPAPVPSDDSMPSPTDYGYGDDDENKGDDDNFPSPAPVPSDDSMPSPTDDGYGNDDDTNGDDGDFPSPAPVPSDDSMPSPTDYGYGDDDENNGDDENFPSPAPVPSDDSMPSPTDDGYGDDDDNNGDDDDFPSPAPLPYDDSMPSPTDSGYGDDDDNNVDDNDFPSPAPVPSDDTVPSPTPTDDTFPTPVHDDIPLPTSSPRQRDDDDAGASPAPVPSDNIVPSPTASSNDTVPAPGGRNKTTKQGKSTKSKTSKTRARAEVDANPFS